MSKHTPGTWRHDVGERGAWRENERRLILPPFDEHKSNAPIAKLSMLDERSEANADLMAAAPDLLSACERLVASAKCPCVVECGDCIVCKAKAVARAAIARATGSDPAPQPEAREAPDERSNAK